MARRAPGAAKEPRFQYGDFWLWYRSERDDWQICWYEAAGAGRTRRTCRKSTGIGGGQPGHPPVEATQALADHYTANGRAPERQQPAEAGVSELLTMWIAAPETLRLARAAQYGYSVRHWERFFEAEREARRLPPRITLADIKRNAVDRFIAFRKAEGIKGETIMGDLATMRRALKWAWENEHIASFPHIRNVDPEDRSGPKELEYSQEQVAAILEAAAVMLERQHVRLFTLIMLSTHGRTEATLELMSRQIRDGRIHFNDSGRRQTTKKRSIVPIAPTLAPWLEGIEGKVIQAGYVTKRSSWANPDVPEYGAKDCYDIGRAFEACLVEAGHRHPSLGLCRPLLGEDGRQLVEIRPNGEDRPRWKGLGSPNTLRHTCHTYHQTVGTPQAQIDAAAGHSGEQGSGRNYTHLRPEYLKQFVEATEGYWREMLRYTKVHLRSHCDSKVVDFSAALREKKKETA